MFWCSRPLWFQKKVWIFFITFLPVAALNRSFERRRYLARWLHFVAFAMGFSSQDCRYQSWLRLEGMFQLLPHALRCTCLCGILASLPFRKVFLCWNGVYGIPRRIRNGGIMPQEKNNTHFLPLFPSNPKQPRDNKNVTFPSTDPMDVTFLMFFFPLRVQPPCRSTPLHEEFFFERQRREELLFDCCWNL